MIDDSHDAAGAGGADARSSEEDSRTHLHLGGGGAVRGRLDARRDRALARQQKPVVVKPLATVSEVSYLDDVGGIICHIQPEDAKSTVIVSLTHLRVHRTLPFATAVPRV